MATGRPGIFAHGTRSHYRLEFDLRPGSAVDEVKAAVVVQLRDAISSGAGR